MPVKLEDGFLQTHDLAHVSCLGMESSRLGECVDRVKRDRVKGVFGSLGFGFNGSNLDFLGEMPWVEAVWFWDVELKRVEGLYALSELRFFGVHPKRPSLDFAHFPKLNHAVIEPKAGDRGLDSLTELEFLSIWHYRPKDGSFASLSLPSSIVNLQVNWANPTTLDSLPALPNLRRLEVHRCRNLESLGNLGEKYPRLEHLVVDACGRVQPSEGSRATQDLTALKHAYIQGKQFAQTGA